MFPLSFSINLLAILHKCHSMIGYAIHYLFCDRYMYVSSVAVCPYKKSDSLLIGVFKVSMKRI